MNTAKTYTEIIRIREKLRDLLESPASRWTVGDCAFIAECETVRQEGEPNTLSNYQVSHIETLYEQINSERDYGNTEK